ncbi:MAG: imidazolonepropionase [Methylobacteriaceae bacterium]|nr:imidazolonepropionase [Methylobacteriaceae bacterium]
MAPKFDRLWRDARIATLDPRRPGLGVIEQGAIAGRDGRIAFVGAAADLPADAQAVETISLDGRWVTPGLIDCHTHIVHGGDRAREFEMRLAGATYAEIAAAGGGILSTVAATRQASEADLVASALSRVDDLISEGVTTIEVKSGYGLTLESETRMLRAARALPQHRPVEVVTTFLGAHAFPKEVERSAYVRAVTEIMIPAVSKAGLADAVDVFCEGIAFSLDETRLVFEAASRVGLRVKAHAEQLSHLGGAALAASFGALSADHLEYAGEEDAAAMGRAGTVAVLLPGAFHMLRETRKPPVEAFRRHAVPIAIATDCNPGSSPLSSGLIAMNLAAILFGLTVEETIAGVTREAARALGRLVDIGTLEAGKRADLAIWDVERLAELPYRMGHNPLHGRVFAGK